MTLTIGEVSGLIAAGVFVLQVLLPLVIPFLLIAFLTDVNSVLTWASLGRYLQSSLWPGILGNSTAASDGVQGRVFYTQWVQTAVLAVLSIASICTPLGLHDTVELSTSQTAQPFGYIVDSSPFGAGTPMRSTAPFTRSCGDQACPGQSFTQTCHQEGLLQYCNYTSYESRMPGDLLKLFNDGASAFSPTVSSIFDMQYRNYINGTVRNSKLGWYAMPTYRHISMLLLEGQDIRVVEGLIVDEKQRGIGFRNHTAPVAALPYGSSWSEDVLFIEPETQCVPLNLTIDFERPNNYEVLYNTINTVLTDRGGLSNLSRTAPNLTVAENGQDFDLRERAYKAAWLNNFLTMAYYNATDRDPSNIQRIDVRPGQTFDLPKTATNLSIGYWNICTSIDLGEYLDFTANASANPQAVSMEDFLYAATLCGGSTASSAPNINSTLIACSLVYGAASRTDGGSDLVVDPGSKWSMPLYTCATAVKAAVKTVTFRYNGTGLHALTVQSIHDKQYGAATAPPPLWGVESIHDQTMSTARPTWGILGPSNATTDAATTALLSTFNLTTVARDQLYLPGYIDATSPLRGRDPVPVLEGQNLPGVDFYTQILLRALSVHQQPSTPYGDYSGFTSMALYTRWQELSASASGTASMIDLIWTDLAANTVVGTRGWGLRAAASHEGIPEGGGSGITRRSPTKSTEGDDTKVPVAVYERKIRYRVPFAIPAFVIAVVTLGVLVALLVLLGLRRTGIARLKLFLEGTSVGRVLALLLFEIDTTDAGWMKAVREKRVQITRESVAVEEESLLHQAAK
ncbi:hypothetical protein ATEIFO6365_0007008100 [Aspergillus terreus]|uniref:Uncharacterized protein n=1 Tax=Aspergillus terreus TaxID=33178 RepID=A0A5M3Z7M1_ASPTE|nr:hypothetical protein ATETN484_0009008100 [Aspergillus terreus]GFF17532.1 hypothetical protein ATEIFO6365_0007008100 [Aspergillus terreus]